MSACSVDIKDMLEYFTPDSSSAVDLYSVFVGIEPFEPFNCITIFDVLGGAPQLTFDKEEKYEYNSVQIRVRSNSYTEGWEVTNLIKDILHGRANESWGDSLYTLIRCTSGPAQLDIDKNQRFRFIINFLVQRR